MPETHEDIRYKVLQRLRESILKSIKEIRDNPEVYEGLSTQLEEYEKLIEGGEDIPVIIRNERIIEGVGRPDIEVFGGRIVIEVKVKTSEFSWGHSRLKDYVQFYPYAEYAIVTNYEEWEFYNITSGILEGAEDIDLDYITKDVLSKGVKIPLSTENVRNIFTSTILLEGELYEVFKNHQVKDSALFGAYRNIIERLYQETSEEEIETLCIKHTLIQMIVSACLTVSLGKKTTSSEKACSGGNLDIEIVLPYLNWWKSIDITDSFEAKFITTLLESVHSKALLFDWSSGSNEDVFRELYEILIDAETRRRIGEYYTPLWLTEFMVNKVSNDVGGLNERTVLDPFCGSGTFLVTTFYRKINEGERAGNAIKEIIGFDVNPLAVSIARAELMMAYQSVSEEPSEVATPLIFHTDSSSLLIQEEGSWKPSSMLEELTELEKGVEFVNYPFYVSNYTDEVNPCWWTVS